MSQELGSTKQRKEIRINNFYMAKIYVADKGLDRAKKVMAMLRGYKHEITYDWATDTISN